MKLLPISATAIFCEDVREEKSGGQTLVGVMPDNAEPPGFPATMSKICLYVRTVIDPANAPASASVELRVRIEDTTETIAETVFGPENMAQLLREVAANGTPIATFIASIMLAQFVMAGPCTLLGVLKVNSEEYIVGSLRFKLPSS